MAFIPPFCPNPACEHHHNTASLPRRWWRKKGSYPTKRAGPIPRFSCSSCRTTFSSQTFSINYYVHITIDLKRLFLSINSSSGLRDIAREFGVTDKVISNRIGRLSRQAIGMGSELRSQHELQEDLVADGFESFVYSQYFPNNYTLLVGKQSQYLYLTDYAQMNRKGRMTAGQRRHKRRLARQFPVEPGQISESFARMIRTMGAMWNRSTTKPHLALYTDEKQEYGRVLDRWKHGGVVPPDRVFVHHRTSSKAPRTTENPLMSVNYFDREIRKDQANHCRQTLQWSKDVNRSMERMFVYGAYHNYFKRYRIKEPVDILHAEAAGFARREVDRLKRRFFTRRYFSSRLWLEESEWRTWFGLWKTPVRDFQVDGRQMIAA